MSKTTENYSLTLPELTDPADITQLNQNWDTIDKALIPNKVYSAIGTHNKYTGSKYVVTVPGLTELYKGLKLTIIPDSTSLLQYIYLNVNDTGNKYLIQTISSNTGGGVYGSCNDWVREGYPITVMFDGNMWRVLSVTVPSAEHLSGIVPIEHGGTGAEDAATALANLGAAPGGYGLGGNSEAVNVASLDELNNITANGWYTLAFTDNLIIGGLSMNYAYMQVSNFNEENCIQKLIPIGIDSVLWRFKNQGVWDIDFEWDNPPMYVGAEFRTTERHLGKVVYAKCVDFGALPNNTTKSVEFCSDGCTDVVSVTATLDNGCVIHGGTGKDLNMGKSYNITLNTTKYGIRILTDYDFSSRSAYVIVKYTLD